MYSYETVFVLKFQSLVFCKEDRDFSLSNNERLMNIKFTQQRPASDFACIV